jgi:hypothetical protein
MNISIEHYANQEHGQNGGAFGATSQEDLGNLLKALEAKEVTGRDTTNLTGQSGDPLKLESLEKTLKVLTFKENDIVFWKRIPKKPAFNTVEEYNQLVSYGVDRGGFQREGELPEEETSETIRRAQLVKFMGTTRSVTLPMAMVRIQQAAGSATEFEIKNGTQWLLRKANKSLYFGDETLIPEEFNGLLAQQQRSDIYSDYNAYMTSDQVIDLRGKALTENAIEDACNTVVENFGLIDQMYGAPKVLSGFVQRFYGNKFIQPNTPSLQSGIMGQRVKSFESQFGEVGLQKDIFFNKYPSKKLSNGATSNKAPATPTASGGVVPVGSDALGKWTSADAGNYFYAVSAWNRYGESALKLVEATTSAVVAGGAVDLTFTATAGPYATNAYMVYRSEKDVAASTGTFHPLFMVSAAELASGYDGATNGSVRDRNRFLNDCDQAMLIQEDNEVLEFGQLAPLMKLDLAITSPAYRFLIMMYGTPFLYAPKKMVRIINIGKSYS